MGAAFNDEPNYFLRGVILVAVGAGAFLGLSWLRNAGIESLDTSTIAQTFFRLRVPSFIGALFVLLGFVSWIRGLMSVAAYLNSCFMTASLGFLVLVTITGVILFVEYRPDLAAKRVAERKAADKGLVTSGDSENLRIFTAVDGRTMKAEFLSFDGKKVTIRRADGMVFTNRVELYSEPDRDYIITQQSRLK